MTTPVTLLLDAMLLAGAVPLAAAGTYLGLLAACSRRAPVGGPAPRALRFDVIVPAHDEAAVIDDTLRSLAALDYPAECVRVTVVADNCTDDTAAIARRAGARVLERSDAEHRGKGYALAFAFGHDLPGGTADAFVVVDADTLVSRNLLSAFARSLANGADAVQASYGVRDGARGWRRRLMVLALALFHDVRSLARERLGLSCGLRGNGMCFSRRALILVPWRAHSLAEDLEHGVELGLAGIRVAHAPDAIVRGAMPAGERAARTQRVRWEGGRAAVARRHRGALLRMALRHGDLVALDLALDLLVPPLSTLLLWSVVGAAIALATWRAGWSTGLPVWILAVGLAGIGTYVARGCMLARGGLRSLADLAWAPLFIGWKLVAGRTREPRGTEWVRTTREAEL